MAKIEVKNLKKSYNSNLVLDDINIVFDENKIYGLLGRNGAQRCGASGGSVVSAGGRHAGAGGAQAVQQLPCRGLSEVTAGQKFRRLYGSSLRFFAPCRFSQGAAAHRKNRRGRKNATFGIIFLT